MASVVFVHGTGVRQPAYYETFTVISEQLKRVAPSATAVECYWAERLGARFHHDGRSVPNYDQTKAIGPAAVSDELALWALLYEDPLAELEALRKEPHEPETTVPGRRSTSVSIGLALQGLPAVTSVSAAAAACAPAEFLGTAVATLVADPTLIKEAIEAGRATTRLGEDGSDLGRLVVARAVVAATLSEAMADGWPPCDAKTRKAFAREVFLALGGSGGQAKGLWGDLFKRVTAPAVSAGARLVTWRMRSRRGALTDAISPVSGDILLYLAHGAPIRRFIRKTIEAAPPPVHVLAHSLGGIACVDLCVLDSPAIKTLITVGSQAPYLYEIGALPSLTPKQKLPKKFPHWINLHDPNDILSYIGNGVFPDRVTDVEVKSGLPFPYSHSAYWKSDKLWTELATRLR
jgi:hypothetical protein